MKASPLPIKRNLSQSYTLSLIIAILMAAASLAGLLFQSALYPGEDLRQSFVSNDVVNMLIGLPILLGSLALARRGQLIGLLFWPGALFYVFYNYATYAFAIPFTWQFVLFAALVLLSIYALVGLLANVAAPTVRVQLKGAVPERFAGGILAGFGALFFVRRGTLVVGALTGQATLPTTELSVAKVDLIVTLAWMIGGVLLWRRQAFGYVTGAGLLFQASMLFVGLLVFFILQPFLAGIPFPLEDFVVVFIMGLVCFVPFGLFVHGVLKRQSVV